MIRQKMTLVQKLTERQRQTLKNTKDKERRAKLLYNYAYDANKRAARVMNLIQDPKESIVLEKPRNMSKRTFEKEASKFQYPINLKFLKIK